MLMVYSYSEMVVPLDHAIKWLQLARHQLQQGGLASAVRTDNGHTAVQVDTQVNISVVCRQSHSYEPVVVSVLLLLLQNMYAASALSSSAPAGESADVHWRCAA